jgi:hypothetical protein
MINSKLGDSYQYSLGVSNQIFISVIKSGIKNYRNIIEKYGNNIEKISYYIREPFIKKWLGCVLSYYNPLSSEKINSAFSNFRNNLGIVISKFILGFNTITETCVYDYNELSKQGVIKIDTPLLNTKLYQRFILNNKVPILLKSIKMYNKMNGIYDTFILGKYENQYSFDLITYSLFPSGITYTTPNDTYTNIYKN